MSDWASLIVTVLKKDGSIRICGDFMVTLNQVLKVDQYPLPRIDDIFETLAGGRKFTKLDISQAYLHMPLDEDSKKLLAISIHRGLYKYNRLTFGIASAPSIWQRAMDQIVLCLFHVHNKLQCLVKMNTFQCLPGAHCPASFEVHFQDFANVRHHFFL
jgi:hypothetical protein